MLLCEKTRTTHLNYHHFTFRLTYIHKTLYCVHQTVKIIRKWDRAFSDIMSRISIYQVCCGFSWQLGMSTIEVFSFTSME